MNDQSASGMLIAQTSIKDVLSAIYATEQAINKLPAAARDAAQAMAELNGKLEELKEHLQDIAKDFVGNCVECSKPLFGGDTGYAYADYDPVACEQHAPSWREIREMLQDEGGWEDPEPVRQKLAEQAAAGRLDERCTHKL